MKNFKTIVCCYILVLVGIVVCIISITNAKHSSILTLFTDIDRAVAVFPTIHTTYNQVLIEDRKQFIGNVDKIQTQCSKDLNSLRSITTEQFTKWMAVLNTLKTTVDTKKKDINYTQEESNKTIKYIEVNTENIKEYTENYNKNYNNNDDNEKQQKIDEIMRIQNHTIQS
jgi:hypothetical protein